MKEERDAVDWPPKTVDGAFDTTHWTMILSAREDTAEADHALSRLCESYWLPVYAFVRSRGYSRDDAQDLTQAFFGELLAKKPFGSADPKKGKFRTYLLGAVKFFLSTDRQKQEAQKRGGTSPRPKRTWPKR